MLIVTKCEKGDVGLDGLKLFVDFNCKFPKPRGDLVYKWESYRLGASRVESLQQIGVTANLRYSSTMLCFIPSWDQSSLTSFSCSCGCFRYPREKLWRTHQQALPETWTLRYGLSGSLTFWVIFHFSVHVYQQPRLVSRVGRTRVKIFLGHLGRCTLDIGQQLLVTMLFFFSFLFRASLCWPCLWLAKLGYWEIHVAEIRVEECFSNPLVPISVLLACLCPLWSTFRDSCHALVAPVYFFFCYSYFTKYEKSMSLEAKCWYCQEMQWTDVVGNLKFQNFTICAWLVKKKVQFRLLLRIMPVF